MSSSQQRDADVVTIIVGQQSLSGWMDVRLTRGIERCPSDFALVLTEKYPGTQDVVVNPSDPIKVMIGSDIILQGYIDQYATSFGPESHEVRITGRGKCQDLVDCSAGESPFQTNNVTLVKLATQLAEPFGITVSAPDGDSGAEPQLNVILTETPFELIERIARWANFLVYEGQDGNLIIGSVGDQKMASGFAEGMNVQTASVSFDMSNRFTSIQAIFLSTAFLQDPPPSLGTPGSQIPAVPDAQALDKGFSARADRAARHRPLLVLSEQTTNSAELAANRAQWDMARRIGRSQCVRLTCDSWRDSAGMLWQVNALAPVNLPSLKLPNRTWLISEVTFNRGEGGTTADLVLMPPDAFVPEPDNLLPFDAVLAAALPGGGGASFAPAPRTYGGG